MIKKLYFISLILVLLCGGCKEAAEEELLGTIYGVVTDKATGEPVQSAGVELSPVGLKTITGTEGQFEFTDLTPGNYTLLVTKTGYADLASSTIAVKSGQTAKGDVQIELLPPALKIVNDKREEISELDFGSAESDVARSFNIFNDGEETLEWQITKTASWITKISKEEGELKAGSTQALIVTIDRSELSSGVNTTTIHITSNNGSKQLIVKATNGTVLATLNTLAATSVKRTSAVFNGEILTDGTPKYSERGFVYALSSMPTVDNTINKLTATLTSSKTFSSTVTGLTTGQTYYVRAYAVNAGRTAYSTNEITFVPSMTLPVVSTLPVSDKNIGNGIVSLNGTIIDVGDPAYTERGFVYGIMHNPTVDSDTKVVVSGSGLGAFSINLSGLTMGTIYYVRAFATNEQGTAYGEEITVDMNAIMPEVVTGGFDFKSSTSVVFNGEVTNVGDPAYTERGFVYGTMLIPTVDNGATKVVAAGTIAGVFNAEVNDMVPDKTYYVRAYAISPAGVVYGEINSIDSETKAYFVLPTFQHNGQTYRVYPDLGSEMEWDQAMQACEDLTFGGYDDWILPSKEVLNTMYINKDEIGGFRTSYGVDSEYWSSSEAPNGLHWYQSFYKGLQSKGGDYDNNYVRPVRLEK